MSGEEKVSKFSIGDKVTSVINPLFLGQIVSITDSLQGHYYTICYFDGGVSNTTNMSDFEIAPAVENGKIGFQNSGKESKDG
jgi:hypothetical protein